MITPLDTFFLLLVLVSAVAVLWVRDLTAAIVIFGAFSLFAAMLFASLGALDVAFTEAAVGAAITTVLFVTVIFRTERGVHRDLKRRVRRRPAVAVALVFGLAAASLLRSVDHLPPVGDPTSPASRHVSPRYQEDGREETGAPNLVTAVLADYRSHDTLGETVVIFTAGLACLLVLAEGERRRREEPS
ncbi:MAG TPA: DUF4040 domain-containing protein [Thermoanaerobaculia bacterium]|nr:DUF4040 domain-containing protein [Thermoanaerobaculia bacterium]